MKGGFMINRRELAPAGYGIAASGGCNEKTLSLSFFGETVRLRVLAIQWGAIGSLAAFTSYPGRVQLPGAPLPLI
jgi:hypothetical protein